MSSFHTATEEKLEINLMDHPYPDMLKVNTRDDITRWWEVMDRTQAKSFRQIGGLYDEESGNVRDRTGETFSMNIRSASGIYHVGPGSYV